MIFLILSVISFITSGILTALYFLPPSNEAFNLNRTNLLFGLVLSAIMGIIFIFIGAKKALQKRILIATINGIIGALLAFIVRIIGFSKGLSIFEVGLAIFVVNFVPLLTWEKNENTKTKSKELIFLSPVIKAVIVGAITGAIETATIMGSMYVSEGWYFKMLNGGYIGAIIGVVIGFVQVSVHNEKSLPY